MEQNIFYFTLIIGPNLRYLLLITIQLLIIAENHTRDHGVHT